MRKRIYFNKMVKKAASVGLLLALLLYPSNNMIARASENTVNYGFLYKNLLDSKELSVYEQAHNAILNYDTSMFKLDNPISETDLEETMNALFNDHPEYIWVNTSYRYAVDSRNIVHKMQLSFAVTKTSTKAVQTDCMAVINSIVDGASNYNTSLEKEKYIYDSICEMSTYNSCSCMNQSAYSALTSGSSVCAGYARAFQIVCQQVGIPCYYITGKSRGVNHAWNIVVIDGVLYNVDLTWDDCISDSTGCSSYRYFNKNDLEFSEDHSRSELSSRFVTALAQQ